MQSITAIGTVLFTDGMGYDIRIGDTVEVVTNGLVLTGDITEWCPTTSTIVLRDTDPAGRKTAARVALDLVDEVYTIPVYDEVNWATT